VDSISGHSVNLISNPWNDKVEILITASKYIVKPILAKFLYYVYLCVTLLLFFMYNCCYSFTFYFLFTLEWLSIISHSFICIINHYSLDVEAIINEITSVTILNHCEHDLRESVKRVSRQYENFIGTKFCLIVQDLKSSEPKLIVWKHIFCLTRTVI